MRQSQIFCHHLRVLQKSFAIHQETDSRLHLGNNFVPWLNSPNLAQATSLLRFLDHTQLGTHTHTHTL